VPRIQEIEAEQARGAAAHLDGGHGPGRAEHRGASGEPDKRYKLALQREPDNAAVLNNLAWVSNELKQPMARQYAERANELLPGNPAVMDTLGVILTNAGEHERGLQLLSRADELAPQAYSIRLNFAKALAQAGQKGAARKELETLAKVDGNPAVQREAAALLAGL